MSQIPQNMHRQQESGSPGQRPPNIPSLRWIAAGLLVVLVFLLFGSSLINRSSVVAVQWSAFQHDLSAHELKTINVNNVSGAITGQFRSKFRKGADYSTNGPIVLTQNELAIFQSSGAKVTFATPNSNLTDDLLIYVLPIFILIAFFVWISRRQAGQLSSIMSIGRSHAKAYVPERPKTTFDDVAGYTGVKQEISEVVDFLKSPERFRDIGAKIPRGILLIGPPGPQPLSAKVLTPSGWTTMGALTVSDEVIGTDGLGHSVLEVYDYEGERDIYEVAFSDGARTRADAVHNWAVQDKKLRRSAHTGINENSRGEYRVSRGHKWEILQTSNLIKQGELYSIPVSDPIEMPKREVPLHPYVLGVLLGDRTLDIVPQNGFVPFTSSNTQFTRLLGTHVEVRNWAGIHWGIRVEEALDQLGLAGRSPIDKSIPDNYLLGSRDQREELLRGLMDSGGRVEHRNRRFPSLRWATMSPVMQDQFLSLVRSLGGTARVLKVNEFHDHPCWNIVLDLPPNVSPFARDDKSTLAVGASTALVRYVKSVVPSGRETVRCILVDAPDHLYVTDDFIVTSNCGKTMLARAVAGEAGVPFLSVTGSDFMEMFVGVGASVTGNTPVFIGQDGKESKSVPIGEFVDRYYNGDAEGFVVPCEGIQALGYDKHLMGFWREFGNPEVNLRQTVHGVYRHRVDEIFEVEYLGTILRATGDHGVFVRRHGRIKVKAVRNLRPGDVLVSLSFGAQRYFAVATGKEIREEKPVVQSVVRKSYDGYVYDLCGCDNEAFFGGESPVLLHNSRVRDLFSSARKQSPAIVFIDEIDSIGRKRGAGLGGGHDEREQTLNQILSEMDGFDPSEGVVVIAATNRPDILDPALLRPGRFDRRVVVPLPDLAERIPILQVHCRGKRIGPNVDLEVVARGTPGMSGADLANLVNEAALQAVRRDSLTVEMQDFDTARDRVLMGQKRESTVLSEAEKERVAIHESGHAVLSYVLPYADPLLKVSIIPTGMALGVTQQLPLEDKHIYRREYIEDSLCVRTGGRVAESIIYEDSSTGASDDLQGNTELARRMVREWGMSDRVGPMAWGSRGAVFLGEDLMHARDYSEDMSRIVDEEVSRILREQEERARKFLKLHLDGLKAVAKSLLEHETIDGTEVARLIDEAHGSSVHDQEQSGKHIALGLPHNKPVPDVQDLLGKQIDELDWDGEEPLPPVE